jgi:hypothetical protein
MTTRTFIKYLAGGATVAAFGLWDTAGSRSVFDPITTEPWQLAIVTALCIMAYLATALIVIAATVAWVKSKGGGDGDARRASELSHGPVAATLVVCLVAMLSPQRAEAWIMLPVGNSIPTTGPANAPAGVVVDQPFTLPANQQAEVDAAILKALEAARKAPGFVMTVECAFGIFIAAVILGTLGYIVVRAICRALDRMSNSISNQLHKALGGTNQAAGLFWGDRRVMEPIPNLPAFNLDFVAPPPDEKVQLAGSFPAEDYLSWTKWLESFGLEDKSPEDSFAGASEISRDGSGGYRVAPAGVTNFVKLVFDRATEITGAAVRKLTLTVPVGFHVNFADETESPMAAFWTVKALSP